MRYSMGIDDQEYEMALAHFLFFGSPWVPCLQVFRHQKRLGHDLEQGFHLPSPVMANRQLAMENNQAIENGKPSISMGHLFLWAIYTMANC